MAEDWCTIECNPLIFTEMIKQFGVENVEVKDVFELNEEELTQ